MRNGIKQSVFSGVSCNLSSDVLRACLPLFEEGIVEAIEWSFDALFRHDKLPDWFDQLLKAYSREGRLVGHGIYYSIFSGSFTADHKVWLERLDQISSHYFFDHVSEHFGFMTGEDFHQGAPLNVPMTEDSLSIARDRMARMSKACNRPVGLENLAFCYDMEGLRQQGAFIEQILEVVNGFLILDLHNVYCQCKNFRIDFEEILQWYPLQRVREIHISGGSWEESKVSEFPIRRDTHDDAVPDEVFAYLEKAIPLLPNLKFVILEQLGVGLQSAEKKIQFQSDFKQMKSIVDSVQIKHAIGANDFLPLNLKISDDPIENELLAHQQRELSEILEQSINLKSVLKKLVDSSLAHTAWRVEEWDHAMVETAYKIAQKWKNG